MEVFYTNNFENTKNAMYLCMQEFENLMAFSIGTGYFLQPEK